MDEKKQIHKSQMMFGTFINYLVLIVQAISIIVITPFLIFNLGDGIYGVYKIVTALIAYMSILNFGFGNAAIRFLTKIKSRGEKDKENEFLSVVKILNLAAILLTLVIGIVLYQIIPSIFSKSLTTSEITLAKQLFMVLIASVIINILNDIYVAVITVHEQFIFLKTVDLVRAFLRVVLIISILSLSHSAIILTLIDFGLCLIVILCNLVFCGKKLHTHPKYSFGVLKTIDRNYYKEVIIYASYFFLNLIVAQLIWNTDSIIIGMRLSSVDVAIYGSGGTISAAFYSMSLVVGELAFPGIVRAVSNGASSEDLTDTMIKIGRFQAFVSLFVLTLFIACGKQFIVLWVGESYVDAWISSIFIMTGTLFQSLVATGHLILRALNRQKFYLMVYLFVFITNSVITYFVVVPYGIIGAAFVTMMSFVIGMSCFILPYFHKKIGLNIVRFVRKIILPVIVSLVIGLTFYFIYKQFDITSWSGIVIASLIYVVVYYIIIYFLILENEEKTKVNGILSKIARHRKA
jgi:O-antigen/teichoic acid export membrane protein